MYSKYDVKSIEILLDWAALIGWKYSKRLLELWWLWYMKRPCRLSVKVYTWNTTCSSPYPSDWGPKFEVLGLRGASTGVRDDWGGDEGGSCLSENVTGNFWLKCTGRVLNPNENFPILACCFKSCENF